MKLRVIRSTDDQYLGDVLDVPSTQLKGAAIPVEDDVIFSITNHVDLGGGKHRYSNAHYVAICEVV
jgi:hypothetical protein